MNNDDEPIAELKSLIGQPEPEFRRRLRRSIDRRVLTRDLSGMYWAVPKLVLIETLFVCAEWLRGKKRQNGGRS